MQGAEPSAWLSSRGSESHFSGEPGSWNCVLTRKFKLKRKRKVICSLGKATSTTLLGWTPNSEAELEAAAAGRVHSMLPCITSTRRHQRAASSTGDIAACEQCTLGPHWERGGADLKLLLHFTLCVCMYLCVSVSICVSPCLSVCVCVIQRQCYWDHCTETG